MYKTMTGLQTTALFSYVDFEMCTTAGMGRSLLQLETNSFNRLPGLLENLQVYLIIPKT